MDIIVLQTSDAIKYRKMIEITSKTVVEYCARHGFQYECCIGIKRGYHLWHATFNRIPLLMRLVNDNFNGWALYLDADAYIHDLDFDLRAYLSDKSDIAFIAAPGGVRLPWYLINAGIFVINLGHPDGRRIVRGWFDTFMNIKDDLLKEATDWDMVPNDQTMIHEFLRARPELQVKCMTNDEVSDVINSQKAQFIRQVLRVNANGMEQRLWRVGEAVRKVLGTDRSGMLNSDVYNIREEFVTAIYQCMLLRDPDAAGLASALDKLSIPTHTLAKEIENCLRSREFSLVIMDFLKRYFKAEDLRSLAAKLAQEY